MSIDGRKLKISPAISCIFFGVFTGVGGGIAYYFVQKTGFVETFGIGPLIGPIVFLIISLLSFVGAIITHIRFKNTQSKDPVYAQFPDSGDSVYDTTSLTYGSSFDTSQTFGQQISWQKIEPLIYKEKVSEETCPICKLRIHEKETILQCPNCQSLFHDQHFIEWILENGSCPTCFTNIDIR